MAKMYYFFNISFTASSNTKHLILEMFQPYICYLKYCDIPSFIAVELYQTLVPEMHHFSAFCHHFLLIQNYLFCCYFSPISAIMKSHPACGDWPIILLEKLAVSAPSWALNK
jgi:hypothetical protein